MGESHTTDRFALELELEKVKRELVRAEEDIERLKKDLSNREEKYRDRENALDRLVSRGGLVGPVGNVLTCWFGFYSTQKIAILQLSWLLRLKRG